ncbi:MAG: flavodoxin domain-containing protein [Tannerellaceae bacterium]|jgi:menaquinone-dependent protoporphyrinogen IX oxidase|nr:flavodoxin domain-containing protein [Tannerellaceae bacterium]
MNKRQFLSSSLAGLGLLSTGGKITALEYYPLAANKKWAIVYGTWCGSTRDAALWISEGMGGIAQVFDVRETPDPAPYENIVIGGAIRGGQVSEELQKYIAENKSKLKAKLRGLFVVCGNMMKPVTAEQKAEMIDRRLAKQCDVKDLPSQAFLGRITYSLMDEASRETLQSFKMPEYDNLKRPECMAFGKDLLAAVNK